MLEFLRITQATLSRLERVHPDCFDHPIAPDLASACVASADAILMVAIDTGLNGGTVVGQCLSAVQRHPDKAAELYIDDLGVASSHRRRGIATRLVERSIELGRAAGTAVMWVGVDPDNAGAQAFYASMGLAGDAATIYERTL